MHTFVPFGRCAWCGVMWCVAMAVYHRVVVGLRLRQNGHLKSSVRSKKCSSGDDDSATSSNRSSSSSSRCSDSVIVVLTLSCWCLMLIHLKYTLLMSNNIQMNNNNGRTVRDRENAKNNINNKKHIYNDVTRQSFVEVSDFHLFWCDRVTKQIHFKSFRIVSSLGRVHI